MDTVWIYKTKVSVKVLGAYYMLVDRYLLNEWMNELFIYTEYRTLGENRIIFIEVVQEKFLILRKIWFLLGSIFFLLYLY